MEDDGTRTFVSDIEIRSRCPDQCGRLHINLSSGDITSVALLNKHQRTAGAIIETITKTLTYFSCDVIERSRFRLDVQEFRISFQSVSSRIVLLCCKQRENQVTSHVFLSNNPEKRQCLSRKMR